MKRITVILTTVVIAIALSANAQPPQGQGKGNKEKCNKENVGAKHEHMTKMLELTEEQKEKVENLRLEHKKNVLPIKNEIGEKKAKLRTLTTTEPIDRKAIDALVSDIGALKTKLMKEKVNHRLNIREILNEEQKVKFDSHKPMGEGKGKGKCGHGK